jgi:Ca-activated chloride channel homolog
MEAGEEGETLTVIMSILSSRRIASLLLPLLLLVPGAAPASDAPSATETISVNYVMVPFVPLDRRGKPLQGIRQRDVKLLVDGKQVATDLFESAADSPVSFTILLDGSGSMGLAGKLEGARAALETLFRNQKPGDDYALYVAAAGKVTELVPFTSSGQRILRAFDNVEPFGKTSVFDAIVRMPDKSILGTNGSRAIILLTDGLDNASAIDRRTLLSTLEAVDVPVYPLGLVQPELLHPVAGAPLESRLDIAVLADLARMSGGRMMINSRPDELQKAVQIVLADLRAQYLVGFAPSGKGNVRFRRIDLEISGPVESVRVRSGYRGTDPPLLARKGSTRITK